MNKHIPCNVGLILIGLSVLMIPVSTIFFEGIFVFLFLIIVLMVGFGLYFYSLQLEDKLNEVKN